MSVFGERLSNGLIKENPTFVLMLGMCGYIISHKRRRYGTFNYSRFGAVKHAYFCT